ncbi:penicillin-binding protein [Microbacteriaceae bacterium VKM Ac-2854]|nr:penicillin-binding protein [Microbacteriaceae bacterium VKM Ac-2854]
MSAHNPPAGGKLARVLSFVGVSLAGGLLITVGVTPALAATGLADNNPIGIFETVPEFLDLGQLAQKTEIYAKNSDGSDKLLASFYAQNREEVAWDDVSDYAKNAAIDTEDPRFYEHGGVDLQGTIRAVVSNLFGNDLQGGSSITQQYVKNVLIQKAESLTDPDEMQAAYDEATATTPERKLKEMKLAIDLEKKYSKQDILLGYLNIAGFGGQVYGIQAASEYYYGVSAKDLSLAQAASLIATVNNPNNLRIDDPENIPANKERRDYVLSQMLKEGSIAQADYDAAVAEEVTPNIQPVSTGCKTAGDAAYFCNYVTWVIRNDDAFGADSDTRWANFQRGGYKIYTSLDLDVQAAAAGATNLWIPKTPVDDVNIGSASVSMQVGTGRILAMVQSKDYTDGDDVGDNFTSINYNTDHAYGGSNGFQVGSTYKVFTLAQWLANGHTIYETVNGNPRTFDDGFPANCEPGGVDETPYKVNNDSGESGRWSVLNGTIDSVNTVFVAMAEQLDLCKIRDQATAFGVHRADGGQLQAIPSAILGSADEIAPLSMATAFAGLANQGKACTAIAIDSITDATGAAVAPPVSTCNQALTPELTAVETYALQDVITEGSAARSNPDNGIEHIGKTGTTDDAVHTWMDGASTKVATVVWVGNITGDASMRQTYVPDNEDGGTIQAAVLRHEIWRSIMTVADGKFGGDDFPTPDNALLRGRTVTVPDVSGADPDDATDTLENLGFDVTIGATVDSAQPSGTVAGTDPAAGTAIASGSEITILVSNGAQVPATTAPTATPEPTPSSTPTATPTPSTTPAQEEDTTG